MPGYAVKKPFQNLHSGPKGKDKGNNIAGIDKRARPRFTRSHELPAGTEQDGPPPIGQKSSRTRYTGNKLLNYKTLFVLQGR
ncbi:hypothetical protein hamaS1_20130 [Moorella sp. Hama-1]|nr:hypothetical protein hamaS1_20130 [Moorella sp. Hama-1]